MTDGRDEVRPGMAVRDAGGKAIGKVKRVHAWGFDAEKGFWSPYQWVFRYEEVLRVRDGVVEVARGVDDLITLARGELPPSWRRGSPVAGGAATPQEAPVAPPRGEVGPPQGRGSK